jgi:hypothetical protein
MHITRRKTRQIKVGKVKVGGGAPISVQSMCSTDTRDVPTTVAEIRRMEEAGCEIIRVAVPAFYRYKQLATTTFDAGSQRFRVSFRIGSDQGIAGCRNPRDICEWRRLSARHQNHPTEHVPNVSGHLTDIPITNGVSRRVHAAAEQLNEPLGLSPSHFDRRLLVDR